MKQYVVLLLLALPWLASGQTKKVLDHPDFAIWNQIVKDQISKNGAWVSYELTPGEGDPTLVLYSVADGSERRFVRGHDAHFTNNTSHLIFTLSPPEDSVNALRRVKTDKEKLPTDTLAILDLTTGNMHRIADLQDVSVPEKWSGYIAYQVKPAVEMQKETEEKKAEGEKEPEDKDKGKARKPSEKNGYTLIVRNLTNGKEDSLGFVTGYTLAEERPTVAGTSTGNDSLMQAGVYVMQCGKKSWQAVQEGKGTYQHLALNTTGDRLAFLGDVDTTKVQVRPFALYEWHAGTDSAAIVLDNQNSFLTDGWIVNAYEKPQYSENGKYLHFGISPSPLVEDTTLLESEKVMVEVWHYNDPVLYTQQNVLAKQERERAYTCVLDIEAGTLRQVANAHLKETQTDRKKNSPYLILTDDAPYRKEASWTADILRDIWIYDIRTDRHRLVKKAVEGNVSLSPDFTYVSWYEGPDSAWYVAPVTGEARVVSQGITVWDEENDVPYHPSSYGSAGWLKGDQFLLLYDRYDIWRVDPTGAQAPLRMTHGRSDSLQYRLIDLDRETDFIDPDQPGLVYVFNERTKESGYATIDFKTLRVQPLLMEKAQFERGVKKAEDASVLLFTRETFAEFPDLRITTDLFATQKRISDANPQQSKYRWGTIELYSWKDFDGAQRQGMLVKPEGFDPRKKYPMIVNFYEKSSDGLYTHRAPYPHRSTINYAFYASRGYVIFNPDVTYEIGHPGESAYNAVVSGTNALIETGFIDPQRIGLQGHSWGGYQVAHILTQTGIFRCAESGAPVVNMISAYGGIRWETGLSRMFQYEHTQSRIGGTLWEKPDLYIENSPIFNADKISTPVLILHNDSDGHVPWYQGIEFFVAMRRLGKEAWMLNYPGEPHWPLKLQNRKDFNIRMQQFFDYYLKDAPKPLWMERGLPSVEKGIQQGYQLIERPGDE